MLLSNHNFVAFHCIMDINYCHITDSRTPILGRVFSCAKKCFDSTFFQKCYVCISSELTNNEYNSPCLCCNTFTGKEKDSETGFYYFGARYYDPSISGLFLSVDPMADKYPNISPYAYCAWNPMKFIDPNGLEKIKAFKSTDENAKNLNEHANNFPENAPVIHLWAHGSTNKIECYDENDNQILIQSAKDMEGFLSQRSKVWRQNHQDGKEPEFTIIVLHSCHTGEGEEPIAQIISTLENVFVVAPNTTVVGITVNDKVVEYGAASYKVVKRVVDGKEIETKVVDHVGGWNMYFNGEKVDALNGITKPIFTKPEKIQEKYGQG